MTTAIRSTRFFAAKRVLGVIPIVMLAASCTYLQKRSLHNFSGVILDADTNKPIKGAALVLHETRHPFLPLPFALSGWRAIAHTFTDASGRFRFSVCMTELEYLVDWDRGDNQPGRSDYRESEIVGEGTRNVSITYYARPPLKKSFDFWFDREDASLAESCI